jgi:hypothetical protein
MGRVYRYVGPADVRSLVRPDREGRRMLMPPDFEEWAAARTGEELAEPFTFVVDVAGVLRLAPRRSEHVVCAGGGEVLSAGEMGFRQESGRGRNRTRGGWRDGNPASRWRRP